MKYLKIFEEYNLAFKIDTDIVMDTLSSLRDDDKYKLSISIGGTYVFIPSDL